MKNCGDGFICGIFDEWLSVLSRNLLCIVEYGSDEGGLLMSLHKRGRQYR